MFQDLTPHFDEAIDFIYNARDVEKGIILVHCVGGMSRSASMVLAYMIKHHNVSLAEAYRSAKKQRVIVSPNIGFMVSLYVHLLWHDFMNLPEAAH
jgi:protein-tyrosine phosphatase